MAIFQVPRDASKVGKLGLNEATFVHSDELALDFSSLSHGTRHESLGATLAKTSDVSFIL